jgi:phosphoribosyl-AMP cyclohydrolase / phosphoribosyl-ATP pyrophosphohydrolase
MNKVNTINTEDIRYDAEGLAPAIVQDDRTKEVLMLAWMDEKALMKTLDEGIAHYHSRSRGELWKKGETSGNIQHVVSVNADCDNDTILLKVIQEGVACHTNRMSCFHKPMTPVVDAVNKHVTDELDAIIRTRKQNPKEGSYTSYLFDKGLDKILKKVGEETAEVIIAAKNRQTSELVYEISDLVYHTLVLMAESGVSPDDIRRELDKRKEKTA